MNEEIQVQKTTSPPTIYLYSTFYISCLCEGTDKRLEEGRVYPIAIGKDAKSQDKRSRDHVRLREQDAYWLLVTVTQTMAFL